MFWPFNILFNRKRKKMTSTENKDGVNQTLETNEPGNTSQMPASSAETAEQWEILLPDSAQPKVLKPGQHDWLKKCIAHNVQIRQVGHENWVPVKEYFFPENSADSVLRELKTLLQRLADEMEYTKIFTTNQKTQIDQLYKENREYKDDMVAKFKEALTKAIIEQLDFIDEKTALYKEKKITQEEFLSASSEFADDLRNVLQNRLDMTCFRPEPGEEVDLKKHKILRTSSTNNPSLHKKILAAKRYGYENEDGKIIRQAFVETYEYVEPAAASDPKKSGS